MLKMSIELTWNSDLNPTPNLPILLHAEQVEQNICVEIDKTDEESSAFDDSYACCKAYQSFSANSASLYAKNAGPCIVVKPRWYSDLVG